MYILLLIIFVHETGHYFFAIISNMKISKIVIYPFGGITIFDSDLNISLRKETLVLIGGILFQTLFFFLIKEIYIKGNITEHVYNLFFEINFILVSFNFLPVIPLDGGKLLNIFLDRIVSYKKSIYITIIISIFFVIIFMIKKRTIFSIILSIFLIKEILIEYKNINYKYNKFLLERYLNNYKFKKIKIIKNINNLRRDYYHIINNEFEENVLYKLFKMI